MCIFLCMYNQLVQTDMQQMIQAKTKEIQESERSVELRKVNFVASLKPVVYGSRPVSLITHTKNMTHRRVANFTCVKLNEQ